MSDPLRKQIDEPEAEQIDQECPAEQIDEPDPDKQIDKPDPTPSASATPEQEIPPNYRNRSTQTHKKRGTRSVRTQTVVAGTPTSSPTKRLLECPTFTEAQAVGEVTAVVTDIDNAQPLGELNEPKDATETCITTEIDFDVGSMTSSVSEESALSDSHIQIDVLSSSESDESSEEDFDFDKRTVLVEGKPPQEQIKFIIFEEAILDVFGQCVQCGSKCVITAENQVGSCFKICIACSTNSEHYFEWTTGPCVSKMAAFHLLLGSAILATGMESSKVLRLFQALKIPNLKQRELSNILKYYTIPAVYNVWNAEQSARLQEAKEEPIVIASDMRVDSPGHSGLFGSGSTLDMTRNVILDTQIIKVNFIALKYDISKCVTPL